MHSPWGKVNHSHLAEAHWAVENIGKLLTTLTKYRCDLALQIKRSPSIQSYQSNRIHINLITEPRLLHLKSLADNHCSLFRQRVSRNLE